MQFAVMSTIEKLGGGESCLKQAEAARFLDMDENMISQVVRSLEKRGLVERAPHDSDRRARRVALTETGLSITLEARIAVREVSATFFAPLESQEPEFVDLLGKLLTTA